MTVDIPPPCPQRPRPSFSDDAAEIAKLTAQVAELKTMLSRFLPANDYECDEGEFNLGGGFLYNEDSEDMGLEVHKLLTRIGNEHE